MTDMKYHQSGGSGSASRSAWKRHFFKQVEAEAEAVMKKLVEAEAEAVKRKSMEAEAEAVKA